MPLTDICWRETKRIEVIDISETVWSDEHTISGRLALSLQSSSAGASFSGRLTGNIPLPGGGTHPLAVDLPSFVI